MWQCVQDKMESADEKLRGVGNKSKETSKQRINALVTNPGRQYFQLTQQHLTQQPQQEHIYEKRNDPEERLLNERQSRRERRRYVDHNDDMKHRSRSEGQCVRRLVQSMDVGSRGGHCTSRLCKNSNSRDKHIHYPDGSAQNTDENSTIDISLSETDSDEKHFTKSNFLSRRVRRFKHGVKQNLTVKPENFVRPNNFHKVEKHSSCAGKMSTEITSCKSEDKTEISMPRNKFQRWEEQRSKRLNISLTSDEENSPESQISKLRQRALRDARNIFHLVKSENSSISEKSLRELETKPKSQTDFGLTGHTCQQLSTLLHSPRMTTPSTVSLMAVVPPQPSCLYKTIPSQHSCSKNQRKYSDDTLHKNIDPQSDVKDTKCSNPPMDDGDFIKNRFQYVQQSSITISSTDSISNVLSLSSTLSISPDSSTKYKEHVKSDVPREQYMPRNRFIQSTEKHLFTNEKYPTVPINNAISKTKNEIQFQHDNNDVLTTLMSATSEQFYRDFKPIAVSRNRLPLGYENQMQISDSKVINGEKSNTETSDNDSLDGLFKLNMQYLNQKINPINAKPVLSRYTRSKENNGHCKNGLVSKIHGEKIFTSYHETPLFCPKLNSCQENNIVALSSIPGSFEEHKRNFCSNELLKTHDLSNSHILHSINPACRKRQFENMKHDFGAENLKENELLKSNDVMFSTINREEESSNVQQCASTTEDIQIIAEYDKRSDSEYNTEIQKKTLSGNCFRKQLVKDELISTEGFEPREEICSIYQESLMVPSQVCKSIKLSQDTISEDDQIIKCSKESTKFKDLCTKHSVPPNSKSIDNHYLLGSLTRRKNMCQDGSQAQQIYVTVNNSQPQTTFANCFNTKTFDEAHFEKNYGNSFLNKTSSCNSNNYPINVNNFDNDSNGISARISSACWLSHSDKTENSSGKSCVASANIIPERFIEDFGKDIPGQTRVANVSSSQIQPSTVFRLTKAIDESICNEMNVKSPIFESIQKTIVSMEKVTPRTLQTISFSEDPVWKEIEEMTSFDPACLQGSLSESTVETNTLSENVTSIEFSCCVVLPNKALQHVTASAQDRLQRPKSLYTPNFTLQLQPSVSTVDSIHLNSINSSIDRKHRHIENHDQCPISTMWPRNSASLMDNQKANIIVQNFSLPDAFYPQFDTYKFVSLKNSERKNKVSKANYNNAINVPVSISIPMAIIHNTRRNTQTPTHQQPCQLPWMKERSSQLSDSQHCLDPILLKQKLLNTGLVNEKTASAFGLSAFTSNTRFISPEFINVTTKPVAVAPPNLCTKSNKMSILDNDKPVVNLSNSKENVNQIQKSMEDMNKLTVNIERMINLIKSHLLSADDQRLDKIAMAISNWVTSSESWTSGSHAQQHEIDNIKKNKIEEALIDLQRVYESLIFTEGLAQDGTEGKNATLDIRDNMSKEVINDSNAQRPSSLSSNFISSASDYKRVTTFADSQWNTGKIKLKSKPETEIDLPLNSLHRFTDHNQRPKLVSNVPEHIPLIDPTLPDVILLHKKKNTNCVMPLLITETEQRFKKESNTQSEKPAANCNPIPFPIVAPKPQKINHINRVTVSLETANIINRGKREKLPLSNESCAALPIIEPEKNMALNESQHCPRFWENEVTSNTEKSTTAKNRKICNTPESKNAFRSLQHLKCDLKSNYIRNVPINSSGSIYLETSRIDNSLISRSMSVLPSSTFKRMSGCNVIGEHLAKSSEPHENRTLNETCSRSQCSDISIFNMKQIKNSTDMYTNTFPGPHTQIIDNTRSCCGAKRFNGGISKSAMLNCEEPVQRIKNKSKQKKMGQSVAKMVDLFSSGDEDRFQKSHRVTSRYCDDFQAYNEVGSNHNSINNTIGIHECDAGYKNSYVNNELQKGDNITIQNNYSSSHSLHDIDRVSACPSTSCSRYKSFRDLLPQSDMAPATSSDNRTVHTGKMSKSSFVNASHTNNIIPSDSITSKSVTPRVHRRKFLNQTENVVIKRPNSFHELLEIFEPNVHNLDKHRKLCKSISEDILRCTLKKFNTGEIDETSNICTSV